MAAKPAAGDAAPLKPVAQNQAELDLPRDDSAVTEPALAGTVTGAAGTAPAASADAVAGAAAENEVAHEDGAVEPAGTWAPLQIPRSRLKMIDFATHRELNPEDSNVGFSARLFAQVSVPLRNPGDIPYYERRNGDVTTTMSPALITEKDGSRVRKYPYGIYPRLALTYVATEAFVTKSPIVDLGRSMRSFLTGLGVDYSGRNAGIVKGQLAALFGSQLSVEGFAATEDGHGTVSEYFQIAKSVHLWWANRDETSEQALWASEVRLSQEFYKSIIDAPVPVDLTALRALGGSSLRYDVYLWSTHRVFYLTKPTRIKWVDLHNQFGAQYNRIRAFRTAFIKVLREVQIVYPALNAEPTEDYLILRPSLTHVTPNKPFKQVGKKTSPKTAPPK